MLKNSVFSKASFALIALLFVLSFLNAQTATTTYGDFSGALAALNSVKAEINREMDKLDQYFSLRLIIKAKLEENAEDQRENIIESLGGRNSALLALGKSLADTMDGAQLMAEMDHVNTSTEKYIRDKIDKAIYQRQGDIDKGIGVGYNEAFANLEAAYNGLGEEDTKKANKDLFNSASKVKVDLSSSTYHWPVPDSGSIFLVQCGNPSGECYGYYDTADEHKKICPHKHGVDGETNKVWWSCFDSSCTHDKYAWSLMQHWEPCRGGCGKLMPAPIGAPPLGHAAQGIGRDASTAYFYYDHEAVCQEPVHSFWNPWAKCGKKYFTCQACPHRASEGVFSNQTGFDVYDSNNNTLIVTAIKDDLYWVRMRINGNYVTSAYPDTDGEATLRKTFGTEDRGNHSVTITVYYNGGNSSKDHSFSISVE